MNVKNKELYIKNSFFSKNHLYYRNRPALATLLRSSKIAHGIKDVAFLFSFYSNIM